MRLYSYKKCSHRCVACVLLFSDVFIQAIQKEVNVKATTGDLTKCANDLSALRSKVAGELTGGR